MNILTRSEWNARPPNRDYVNIDWHSRPGLETHHSVGVYGAETPEAFARGVQNDHLGRNWTDTFYNYLLWYDGLIIEGRPDHAKSGPIEHLTVCFAGNYNNRSLTDAQNVSWHQLRDYLRGNDGGSDVAWHGQRARVGCPGSNVINWLKAGHPLPANERNHPMNPDICVYSRRNIDFSSAAGIGGAKQGKVAVTHSVELAQAWVDAGVHTIAVGGGSAQDLRGEVEAVGADAIESLIKGAEEV